MCAKKLMATGPPHPTTGPIKDIAPNTMTALIIVDFQNDFAKITGSLSVPDATSAIPVINALRTGSEWTACYLSADWHPANHCSFKDNNPGTTLFQPFTLPDSTEQIAWPRHCVAHTDGAKFHADLHCRVSDITVFKGCDPKKEAYSAFAGHCDRPFFGDQLVDSLKRQGIMNVTVCGLATDYCVKATALDAARLGFETTVILAACRGVSPETTAAAIKEMKVAGVRLPV